MPKPVRSNIYTYQIGNTKSINRAYNFVDREDGNQGPAYFWNNYFSSFRRGPVPPYPILDNKIVALLDYDYELDLRVKNTLEFYFTNYNTIYKPFPIENTLYSTENTLKFLQSYYNQGYRYFLLTAHSGTIAELLNWFNENPDAVGYSCYSQSTALSVIPKNIYTLTPYSDTKMDFYSYQCIIPYDVVYFLYNADPIEIYNQGIYDYIKNKCNELGKTFVDISFIPLNDVLVPTVADVMNNRVQGGQNASIITSFLTYTPEFYNAFYNTTPQYGYNFYEIVNFPNFTNPESIQYFVNKLYVQSTSQANLNSSYLFDVGYQTLGANNYASPVLNCLQMAYGSENNLIISQQLSAHIDTLFFEYVYKYSKNNSASIYLFKLKGDIYDYVPFVIYYGNKDGLIFASDVPNPFTTPVIVKSIPAPSGPKRKAIALLEFNSSDRTRAAIYYYNATTTIFEPLTVLNTQADDARTLELLETNYNNGYRIFLGFERSTTLSYVLDWFNTHPDAVGISISSSAISLATVEKNIYRLQPNDSFVIDSIDSELQQTIDEGGRIFYVYSKDELASEEIIPLLNSKYGESNIILYPVNSDDSNLNQQSLYNFFITTYNATSKDSIVAYLILANQDQKYVDLFNSSLVVPSQQYDIVGIFANIDPQTTSLNGLFNAVIFTNITSSELLNLGLEYLNNNFTPNTLNALYMISAFVNNQNVLSLASYSSCLQFNQYNDAKYGSLAVYKYNDYVYQYRYIYSKDPIYGQLIFTQI